MYDGSSFNLERDLMESQIVRQRVQSDREFATELYAALCNNQFVHRDMPDNPELYWSCSWRYAGEIIADIEQAGGDYMEYYCGGNEGTISPQVATMLQEMGWTGKSWVD